MNQVPGGQAAGSVVRRRWWWQRQLWKEETQAALLPALGSTVGGYHLEAKLGKGGQGTVYRARRGGQLYAVKFPRALARVGPGVSGGPAAGARRPGLPPRHTRPECPGSRCVRSARGVAGSTGPGSGAGVEVAGRWAGHSAPEGGHPCACRQRDTPPGHAREDFPRPSRFPAHAPGVEDNCPRREGGHGPARLYRRVRLPLRPGAPHDARRVPSGRRAGHEGVGPPR